MRRVLTGFVLLVACGGAAPNLPPNATRDSAGVTIIENYTPVWDTSAAWRLGAGPALVLDNTVDLGGAIYIMHVKRLANGDIVLLTNTEGMWFDSLGARKQGIARDGDGPGEFRYTTGLLRLGDSIAVVAAGYVTKLAVYAPDGSLAREFSPNADKLADLHRWAECGTNDVLPDMSMLRCIAEGDDSGGEAQSEPTPGLSRRFTRRVVVPPTLDTLYPLGREAGLEQFMFKNLRGDIDSDMHPFHSRGLGSVGGTPTRIGNVMNPAYEIEIWTPDGRLERLIRRPRARDATTPELIEAARERMWSTARFRRGFDSAATQHTIATIPVPDSLPAGIRLLIGNDNYIYLQRDGFLGTETASRVDVFNPTGAWLGTLTLPPRFRLLDAGLDYLLGVHHDVDDIPQIEMWRVTR